MGIKNSIKLMIKKGHKIQGAKVLVLGITFKENCPDIDFLCVQFYGDIENLAARLDRAGYQGPYLVTEWGATGHWEVPATPWGAPVEQTSSEKAAAVKYRYENSILADSTNCMGSYVFLWGQKQELSLIHISEPTRPY